MREAIVLRAACPTNPSSAPDGASEATAATAGRPWVGATVAALSVLLAVMLISGVVA